MQRLLLFSCEPFEKQVASTGDLIKEQRKKGRKPTFIHMSTSHTDTHTREVPTLMAELLHIATVELLFGEKFFFWLPVVT